MDTNQLENVDKNNQVVGGAAHIVINDKATTLTLGQVIIIPAHKASHIDPNGRFKLLLTVIKSGYEE